MGKNWIGIEVAGLILGVAAGVTNAKIIAYWPFDEGLGDVAKDVVGGYDAKLTGIDWVAGKNGGFAAQSSRGSDSIFVGPGPTPTTKDLSLAWWMVDTYDSYHTMLNKGLDASPAGHSILLRPTSEDSPLRFRIGGFQAYGGWGAECRVPLGACKDGEWVHVVCTYDFASDTATIYLNGQVAPNGNYNPKTGIAGANGYCQGTNDPTQPLYIVGQRETFGGTVDEAAIWDHALSAGDAAKVFTLGPLALDPRLAGRPSPADGAGDVLRETVLAWSAGAGADTHDVYLGTVSADVNNATRSNPQGLLVGQGQSTLTYDPPGRLAFGTTYCWRIDEIAPGQPPFRGTIWHFTTEPAAYPVEGRTIKVTASSADVDQGPQNTINGSGLADDLHSNDLITMWLTAPDATGPAWIQYEFDQVLRLDSLWIWNHNGLLEAMLGLGSKEVKIEYSANGTDYTALGTTHELARAPGRNGYEHNNTIDLQGIAARYVRLTILSNWGGVLKQYGLSEVRFFHVPVLAREPAPGSGARNVDVAAALTWRAGREAARHQVYLGTDRQAVTDGNVAPVTVSQAAYSAPLDLDTTYYWKVVEVNDAETPSTWAGDVWTFTTEPYRVVDDFEGYTNDQDKNQAIFQTWLDGLENPANGGSQVGNDPSPFAEQTIVNSGRQSMPLAYNNTTATNSETTRTLASPQDWSQHNIKGLTLRFYGNPANAAQQMYVKINNTRVAYDGAPEDLLRPQWQMWYIDLAALNVDSVSKLSIGFDRLAGVGGQGKVLIDDIRLYPRDRARLTPVAPGTTGLQVQYLFDGNLDDSSGNGRKGSAKGGPMFLPGKLGQAVSLDGYDDYVNIDGYKGICADATGVQQPFTISAWVQTTDSGDRTIASWGTNTNRLRVDFRLAAGALRVEHGGGNVVGNTALNDGEWHHVALTMIQGATVSYPEVALWLDGRDDSKATVTAAAFAIKAGVDMAIGYRATAAARYFLGAIDEVRLYDRVLSPGEISFLAGRTMPFDKPF